MNDVCCFFLCLMNVCLIRIIISFRQHCAIVVVWYSVECTSRGAPLMTSNHRTFLTASNATILRWSILLSSYCISCNRRLLCCDVSLIGAKVIDPNELNRHRIRNRPFLTLLKIKVTREFLTIASISSDSTRRLWQNPSSSSFDILSVSIVIDDRPVLAFNSSFPCYGGCPSKCICR